MIHDPEPFPGGDDLPDEPDEFMVEIGRRIREARQKSKIGVPELCEKVGCGKGWIYGVETGRQNFQISTFRRLLKVLGVEFRDVVIRESEVGDRVPNKRLHEIASRSVLQLSAAAQVLNEVRALNEKLLALTDVDRRNEKPPH